MKPLARYPDWEARLSVYLDRVSQEPFKWGSHDCATFAADCIKAQTGVDPAADFRGRYDDARGAALALRELGPGTLLRTAKLWLGEPISVHFAHRGDIVMRDARTCGVCVGQYSWFIGNEQGLDGLVVLSTRACRYAFRVPYQLAGTE